MGGDLAYLDIIIFAAVAAFLVFRLRALLGRRTGHERPPGQVPVEPFGRAPRRTDSETLPERRETPAPRGGGLAQIKLADRNFDASEFLVGARVAFEAIVTAFAQGNKAALRPLLSDEVFGQFAAAIDERIRLGHTQELRRLQIRRADIAEAHMEGSQAFVSVKFASDQVIVTLGADGKPIEELGEDAVPVEDVWTFMRDTKQRDDPNWLLVATQAPD